MMCDKTIVAVKVAKAELELAKDLFGVGAILKDLESGAIVDLTDEEFISARPHFTDDLEESQSSDSDFGEERPSDACVGTVAQRNFGLQVLELRPSRLQQRF
jgi:hypothetical protein